LQESGGGQGKPNKLETCNLQAGTYNKQKRGIDKRAKGNWQQTCNRQLAIGNRASKFSVRLYAIVSLRFKKLATGIWELEIWNLELVT
jgi:hypothetical protein